MNHSYNNLSEWQANIRKSVFRDIERHFSAIDSPLTEEVINLLMHLPFNDSVEVNCFHNEKGQFELTVGLSDDGAEMNPLWSLGTGVTAGITIYAPTQPTTSSDFYCDLMEHMFNVPTTDDLVHWWANPVSPLPTHITFDFTDNGAALCAIVIDLCNATTKVAEDPWSDF